MSSKANTITTIILRKLWTFVAVVLVLFALLMSALRYSLPMLDDRKDIIEDYVMTEYGLDLAIGEISAEWQASGPNLVLLDVQMRQGDSSPITLDVGELKLLVDFWPSLLNMNFQSKNVQLSNLHLQVNIDELSQGDGQLAIVDALESVFLEQLSNFSVSESKISISANRRQKSINVDQLTWLNKDERHQGWGLLSLDNFSTTDITFVLDLRGNVESYSGTFYSQGKELDISPWLNEFVRLDAELAYSDVNFSMWADIQDGTLTRIHSNVEPSKLSWGDAEADMLRSEFSAQIAAEYLSGEWFFAIDDIVLRANDMEVDATINGVINNNGDVHSKINGFEDIERLFPLISIFNAELYDSLLKINPRIDIATLGIAKTKDGFFVNVPDILLSTDEHDIIPGIDMLSLSALWWNDKGIVNLEQETLALSSQSLFDQNTLLSNVSIPIFIQPSEEGYVLNVEQAKFSVDGLLVNADFEYSFKTQFLSLRSSTESLALDKVKYLLPNQVLGSATKTFLTKAFVGKGQIEQANILWHGSLKDYPFTDNQGVFNAKMEIGSADFLFSDEWPALNDLDITLNFINKSLLMSSPRSLLGEVQVKDIKAEVLSLDSDALLRIEATGMGSGEQLAKLMRDSSLSESLGRILTEQVIVEGELATELELFIPLTGDITVSAIGEVLLAGNDVDINALGLGLKNANGVLAFDNQNLMISGLQADLFDQAITLDLESKQLDKYELDIDIQGSWQVEPLLSTYLPGLLGEVSGEADFLLDLNVALDKDAYEYAATLSSDLLSLDSQLPYPLKKTSIQKLPLRLVSTGDNIASVIRMNLGNTTRFEGTLPHKEKRFNRAHLSFGNTDFFGMGVGFSISANLPLMNLNEWTRSLSGLVASSGGSGNSIIGLPERIFIETEQLVTDLSTITDLDVVVRRNAEDWALELDSDQVRGRLTIHDEWVVKGIDANLDYVRLPLDESTTESTDNKPSFDPSNFPSINFNCRDCNFGKYALGKIELEASPNSDGLEIEQLLIDNGNGRVNAQGQWYKRHSDHYTFIAGDLVSQDIGRAIEMIGVDSGIKDSGASFNFALTWQKSPFEFALDTLGGEVDWQLSDGYLTEVSDQGSRIFTLLSFSSLVRKLSLDFRDVFAKGFFYDSMQGSLQITDGKVDTRDTVIDGAAGEIEIYGYTDLVTQELNYNVSFAPNVTGNLPVLVYFFTVSPPSALAALAIDQVLTSAKVISNVNYSVTGTIEEPILIETGRESTEVELPTRRFPDDEQSDTPFIPPTTEELIELRQDG